MITDRCQNDISDRCQNDISDRCQNDISDRCQHEYKLLILGEMGAGKSALVKRYAHGHYINQYKATLGVDFSPKVIERNGTQIKLQLWDVAGQERFGSLTQTYYRGAVGALIVFDVDRDKTFNCITRWKDSLDQNLGQSIPIVLVASKMDLFEPEEELPYAGQTHDQVAQFCRDNHFLAWFRCPPKINTGIEAPFNCLIDELLRLSASRSANDHSSSERRTDVISVDQGCRASSDLDHCCT